VRIAIKINTFVHSGDGFKGVGFSLDSYNIIEDEIGKRSLVFSQETVIHLKNDVFEKVNNAFRFIIFSRANREIERKITDIEKQKKFAEEFIEKMFKAIEEKNAK